MEKLSKEKLPKMKEEPKTDNGGGDSGSGRRRKRKMRL